MTDPNGVVVGVTCECGKRYDIGVAGVDLETYKFTCPECGQIDQFTPDQIAQLVAAHGEVAERLRRSIRDAFNK